MREPGVRGGAEEYTQGAAYKGLEMKEDIVIGVCLPLLNI